jgi:MFS family permease
MKRQYHPLIQSWLELRGNPRACIYVEPLWGIAFNLFAPFATLYMSHLGVSDTQVGLLLTIGMAVQILSSLLSSVLIDKMGRRWSAMILGLLCWTLPPAILMLSQNFWWFLAAAIFNGFAMIESVAWNCLLVEDAEPTKLVDMYNWVTISGLLAVFFAPIAGMMVRSLSLVTAMRIIYGFALIMMTAKTIILFFWSKETQHGLIRMRETRGVPYTQLLGQYRTIFRLIIKSPSTLQVLVIIGLIHITNLVNSTFFSLFATKNAAVPEWLMSYFPMVRSAIMLVFFFGIQNWISRYPIKQAMIAGIVLYLAAIGFLLLSPAIGSGMLIGYILLDAFAFALVWPRRNSLLVMYVDPHERARILGLMYVLMIACASPFGWLAGKLSEENRALPFVLNAVLYVVCIFVLFRSKPLTGIEDKTS